jgi:hypothetical protein
MPKQSPLDQQDSCSLLQPTKSILWVPTLDTIGLIITGCTRGFEPPHGGLYNYRLTPVGSCPPDMPLLPEAERIARADAFFAALDIPIVTGGGQACYRPDCLEPPPFAPQVLEAEGANAIDRALDRSGIHRSHG